MTQYTVKYDLTEKEEAALRELLPNYQQYISAGGSRPFENSTSNAMIFYLLSQA